MKKKVLSLVCALSTFLSIGMSASAESISADSTVALKETVQVGEYQCYVENGQYYTVLDGETYLVINLDEAMPCSSNDGVSVASVQTDQEIDINGSSYNGQIDISNGDFATPIFCGDENGLPRGYQISTGFIFENVYQVTPRVFNTAYNAWVNQNTVTIAFGLFQQTKILYTGTTATVCSKAQFIFHKDGSTGEPVFNYTISEII
ncbi:MAG: hypothetical protein IJO91_11585 [Oscillospiraceae bacterium]|nr:hypothetical protein [Oscillospiraceae bacterium]